MADKQKHRKPLSINACTLVRLGRSTRPLFLGACRRQKGYMPKNVHDGRVMLARLVGSGRHMLQRPTFMQHAPGLRVRVFLLQSRLHLRCSHCQQQSELLHKTASHKRRQSLRMCSKVFTRRDGKSAILSWVSTRLINRLIPIRAACVHWACTSWA